MNTEAEKLLTSLNIFGERAYASVVKQIVTNLWIAGISVLVLIIVALICRFVAKRAYHRVKSWQFPVFGVAMILASAFAIGFGIVFAVDLFQWTNNPDYVILKKLGHILNSK